MKYQHITASLFLSCLLFIFTTCEEEKPIKRSYPQVRTGDVTNITSEGVRFTGLVVNDAGASIEEHGFVWENNEDMNVRYAEKVLLGSMEGGGDFTTDISFALKPDFTYYVRAFVQSGEITIYGDPVKFISLGSKAPVITDFEPKSASWGDTITIFGENFSYQGFSNKVYFGTASAQCTKSSSSEICVVVPGNLTAIQSNISVELLGNTSISQDEFELIIPGSISSISKSAVTWGDTIDVAGQFPVDNYNMQLSLNGQVTQLIESSSSLLKTFIPNSFLLTDSVEIALGFGNKWIIHEDKLRMKQPVINSFEPAIFGWHDTIILNGLFHPVSGSNYLYLSGISLPVLETGKDKIKCIVPFTASGHNNQLSLTVHNSTISYPDQVSLAGPVLDSISPLAAAINEEITIYGKYYGNQSNTVVAINGIWHSPDVISPGSIKVTLNDQLNIGSANVLVKVFDKTINDDAQFSIIFKGIADFSPLEGTYGDLIVIHGENLNLLNTSQVRIGDNVITNPVIHAESIEIIVPDNLILEYNTISIYNEGKWYHSEEKYHSLPPVITQPLPTTVNAVDEVITIVGENFSPVNSRLFIGGIEAIPYQLANTSLQFEVPVYIGPGDYQVTLNTGPFGIDFQQSLHVNNPYVNIEDVPVTDIDGNTYRTLNIDGKIWMAENLRATRFQDGTNIPIITDNNDWWNYSEYAMCYSNNDIELLSTYGMLYNSYVVSDVRNICPSGWHVPSHNEWMLMINLYGGSSIAGGFLKESGTAHWISPNTGASNSTGFTALPAGYRAYNGIFSNAHQDSHFWSSTYRVAFTLNYASDDVVQITYNFRSGMSIRCVKD